MHADDFLLVLKYDGGCVPEFVRTSISGGGMFRLSAGRLDFDTLYLSTCMALVMMR